ncbi:hypothetical protein D2A77_07745 [Enterococcus faecalis]|nr:hypothetical protein [Enterococcus faecalis]EGO8995945.1 hypothetical protein [Enterococcus faecalis]
MFFKRKIGRYLITFLDIGANSFLKSHRFLPFVNARHIYLHHSNNYIKLLRSKEWEEGADDINFNNFSNLGGCRIFLHYVFRNDCTNI